MEAKVLRLLIVDDSPDEAELALTALRKGGFMLKPQRVNDRAGLQAAVDKGGWDAIVTERTLPHFGVAAVLDAVKLAKLECPILILTRTIPDSEIATLMRGGVRDVILKNQMARLLPALERELAVAAERAAHRAIALQLAEIQNKHRAVVEGAREAVCYSQDGMHIDANKAYLDLFEYADMTELEGVPVMNLIDKNDQARFKQFIRKSGEPGATPLEVTAIRKGGARFPVEITVSPVTINGESCTQILVSDVSKRKAVESKLQHLNQCDPLTGLYHRQHFLRELEQTIELAKKSNTTHGVVHIDFHQLPQIVKAHGHAIADRFLLGTTRTLRETLGADAPLARYGEYEFAVLARNLQPTQLRELTVRVEQALKASPAGEGGITIQCEKRVVAIPIDRDTENAQKAMAGIHHVPAPAAKPAPAVKPAPAPTPPPPAAKPAAAAKAPAPAKAAVPPAAKVAHNAWHQRLQVALEQNAFRLIYQPIVNLHAEAGEYFEVLVRLVGDDGELIPAGQFMQHAENNGQSVAIDRWVIQHAIHALGELRRQGRKVRFFINLSASALANVELVLTAQQTLHETGLKGKYVIFEIDEGAVARYPDQAVAFVRAASKIDCRFCIDNFGRTLGAANRLREEAIEYLKLDGSLVQNLTNDSVTQASLKAVVDVAKMLEKKTIAKCVEAAEALSVLWTLGIDYVQGHYFQEGDTHLNYAFTDETTISDEQSPQWAVASKGKSH